MMMWGARLWGERGDQEGHHLLGRRLEVWAGEGMCLHPCCGVPPQRYREEKGCTEMSGCSGPDSGTRRIFV
eukprot:1138063-Pelagomonas_calceolata.AAC.3